MQVGIRTLTAVAIFLLSVTGCTETGPRVAKLVGGVGSKANIVDGVRFRTPSDLSIFGAAPLPNATVAIVVGQAGGDHVIASVATAPDGSFTLEYPRDVPIGAAILVTADGHEAYREVITPTPPGYKEISFALKRIESQ